ncbi:MAG: cadmium-translocating P-type ATPase [Clostridia bacterium]|nr:cadmium-translocating P-type ATPase [Clostridia bacterium]
MSKKQKRMLRRILIAGALFLIGLLLPQQPFYLRLAVFLITYAVIGYDVLYSAARNILHGQVCDENFLMAIATIGAFLVGEYPEGVAVMLFYQVGELFQSYAVGRSRASIAELMDIRPDYATIESGGELLRVDPEEVGIGSVIVVKPGEKIPLDGVVVEGHSELNTAALTGESMLREVDPDGEVISGCINIGGVLRIRVTKEFGESTVAKILDLVENASSQKARTENFITRFARYYTPVVVIAAILLALIPPIILGGGWSDWIHRALIFLVVSCPCALVISVPLSFFGGIGGASKCGILVKGSNYLEALAHAETVVFDKTGTLTRGSFHVAEISPQGMTEQELLTIAALAESYSDHPISQSLKRAVDRELSLDRVVSAEEMPGHGVKATVDGKRVLVGSEKLMEREGIPYCKPTCIGTVIHVAVENVYAGCIVIADEVKPESATAIASLKTEGIRRTVMLTGDAKTVGESIAKELGIDEARCELLPADKVARVEALLAEKSSSGKLVFVGDGINDAPVLSRVDIGIAMGAMGSDAAIEAADIVLMDDDPNKVALAIRIARRTLRIVKQNIVFALFVKVLVMVLGALGVAGMWEAVFADVGVAVIAILNAMRALHIPTPK